MEKKILYRIIYSTLLAASFLISQETKILDSLNLHYRTTTSDTAKILLLAEISKQFSFSNPDTAILLGRQALLRSEQLNFKKGETASLNSIANAFFTQSNYKESWSNFSKALRISELINDNSQIAYALLNLGNIYYYQNNKTLALEYFQQCLSIGEKINDARTCASAYINIGCIFLDKQEYQKGLDYLYKAEEYFKSTHDKKGLSYCYRNIALAHQLQQNNLKAITYLKKSLQLGNELQNKEIISGCLQALAEIFRLNKDNAQSIVYGKQSLRIAQEINDLPYVQGAATTLYLTFLQQNDFQHALEYYRIAEQAGDSIVSADKNKELKNIQHQFEIDNKQKEIELLEQKGEIQQLLTIIITAGLCVAVLFSLLIFRNFRKEQKAKQVLAEINKEREVLIGEIQHALENIKTLGELLPICGQCRKIRDDKGYWQAVEGYIIEHTDTKFSHGICPDCMEVLYPKYAAKIKKVIGYVESN